MKNKRTLFLTEIAILVAIIFILAFTPIGYLKIPTIEITFLTVPVVVGAIVIGPGAGAILGAFFGITSFVQCFGMSTFGAALLAINPVLTFILCFVPRILVGLLTGLIFRGFKNKSNTSFIVASFAGPILNSILFVGFLIHLFGQSSYIQELQGSANLFAFIIAFVGLNGIIEALVCGVIGTLASKAVYKMNTTRLK